MDRNFSRFYCKGSKKLYIQNYYLVSAPSWQKIREWQSFLFPAWNSHVKTQEGIAGGCGSGADEN